MKNLKTYESFYTKELYDIITTLRDIFQDLRDDGYDIKVWGNSTDKTIEVWIRRISFNPDGYLVGSKVPGRYNEFPVKHVIEDIKRSISYMKMEKYNNCIIDSPGYGKYHFDQFMVYVNKEHFSFNRELTLKFNK